MTKLSWLALVPVLALVPACGSSTEPSAEPPGGEEENLGRTSQALCLFGPGPRPVPEDYVPGPDNPIVSESYGSGSCDGYAVQFSGINQSAGYRVNVVASPSPSTESSCNATTITLWVWHRYNGGPWVYAGAHSGESGWLMGCLTMTSFNHAGPSGSYDVLVKAQGRTESVGGGAGYAYNRSVKVVARKAVVYP